MIEISAVFAFIAAGADMYSMVVVIAQILKGFNYRYFQFMVFSLGLGACYFVLTGVVITIHSFELAKYAIFFTLTGNLFMLFAADTLKREQVEPVKLAGYLVLYALTIIGAYITPNAVYFAPDMLGANGILFNPIFGLLVFPVVMIPWAYYCHCAYLVYKAAPAPLKRHARVYFTGAFLGVAGVLALLTMSLEFTYILMSIGLILMAYVISHEPKLLFVLPFKAIRLTVLDTGAGIPLYTHTWVRNSEIADEDLFSGVLQGIGGILKESLNKGDVQEIRMTGAIIIAYRIPEYPIAFVLVATRPSQTLRDALKIFAARFCDEFHTCFATLTNVGQFSPAERLVTACFPHVPVYN